MRIRGFTRIEFVITLVTIGLLASAAMPLAKLVARREQEAQAGRGDLRLDEGVRWPGSHTLLRPRPRATARLPGRRGLQPAAHQQALLIKTFREYSAYVARTEKLFPRVF
jgi:hypothetical protein